MSRRDFTITISGYVEEPNGEQDVAEAVRHAVTAVDHSLRANGGEAMNGEYEMAKHEQEVSN
jgi:hypothetical protein